MPRGNNIVTTVDELINPVDFTWDAELVRSIFWGNRCKQDPANSNHTGERGFCSLSIITGMGYFLYAQHIIVNGKLSLDNDAFQYKLVGRTGVRHGRNCGNSKCLAKLKFLGGGLSMDLYHAEISLQIDTWLIWEDALCV